MNIQTINQPVSVTRFSFGRNMRMYPCAIEFDGTQYEFVDRGLGYTVQKQQYFSLSDGTRDFWLREGRRGSWTLIGMSA